MTKYLTTKNFSILEIKGFSPEQVDESCRNVIYDDSKDKPKLNSLRTVFYREIVGVDTNSKTVYEQFYKDELTPFMKEHNLKNYVDLTTNVDKNAIKLFTHEQIADRLYVSQRSIPKKIFTACKTIILRDSGYIYEAKENYDKADFFINDSGYKFNKNISYDCNEFNAFKNLLGDVFVINSVENKDKYVRQAYYGNDEKLERFNYIEDAKLKYDKHSENCEILEEDIFHTRLSYYKKNNISSEDDFANDLKKNLLTYEDDWVEIIPFKNIFFLKGKNGDYDFVFKNLKTNLFDIKKSFFEPYIFHKDLPSAYKIYYDFRRWQYFGYKDSIKNKVELWQDNDEHLSEIEYYKNEGSLESYPGDINILIDYYKGIGKYRYDYSSKDKIKQLFKYTESNEKETFCVSDLITNENFMEFLEEKPDYLKSRKSNLDKLSLDNDNSLPVIVTYYDAMSYCKWVEDKYKVKARLLTTDEYFLIHPKPEGYGGFYDYKMTSKKMYDQTIKQYLRKEDYVISKGMHFCIAPMFGEWLFESNERYSSCIFPYTMGTLEFGSSKKHVKKPNFLRESNGRYKNKALGFRICYSLKSEVQNENK